MHCENCVIEVTKRIKNIPGINSVQINLATSEAILDTQRDILLEEISLSLQNTDYTATNKIPNFINTFRKWFKKYFALIVAFSAVVMWTLSNCLLFGWNFHFAMHDFMGGFFILFGTLKVLSWKKFAESYGQYDPLAMRSSVYAYLYPAIEVFLGVVYQFRLGTELYWNIFTVIILGIATYGIIKVLRRKEIVKCACLGGSFNIPITWFTVFENSLMIFMAVYMQIVFRNI
jgi:copper chaperone CopZ